MPVSELLKHQDLGSDTARNNEKVDYATKSAPALTLWKIELNVPQPDEQTTTRAFFVQTGLEREKADQTVFYVLASSYDDAFSKFMVARKRYVAPNPESYTISQFADYGQVIV
jgi:hypothetical protein